MNHRMVDIPAARLARWLTGFAERNGGPPAIAVADNIIELLSPGGAQARLEIPYPKQWAGPKHWAGPGHWNGPEHWSGPGQRDGLGDCTGADRQYNQPNGDSSKADSHRAGSSTDLVWPLELLVEHALADRDVLAVLVRRGGYAIGLQIADQVTFTKCGTKYVQGRTAAGGWSQQRFARRRQGQTATIVDAAAHEIVRAYHAAANQPKAKARPQALVLGGDRTLVEQSLADLPQEVQRWVQDFEASPLRNIGDPRRKHLDEALANPCLVRIKITD